MGREVGGGSEVGTYVRPWQIHVDVWQNQYSIAKLKKIIIIVKQDPSPQESVFVLRIPVHLGTGWTGSRKSYPFTFFSLYVIDLVLLIDIKERIPLVKTNASRFYLLVHF